MTCIPLTLSEADWQHLLDGSDGAEGPAADYYRHLVTADGWCLAHIAQSIDGRIAMENYGSQWLSGQEDLLHAHRIRAMSDAIIVGASTVQHDDPQLTVRQCAGDSPVRVVIDPNRRLSPDFQVFQDDAAETFHCVRDETGGPDHHGNARVIRLPFGQTGKAGLEALITQLQDRGLHKLFVEGGGTTISRFLQQDLLDILEVVVTPVLIGSGIPSFSLPTITNLDDALRPSFSRYSLGQDTLFSFDLKS